MEMVNLSTECNGKSQMSENQQLPKKKKKKKCIEAHSLVLEFNWLENVNLKQIQ